MAHMLCYSLLPRIAGLCLLMVLAAMMPGVARAADFYCCKDENNHQVCGDHLPDACKNRAYRIVNAVGSTIREIPAPLTPEQMAQLFAEKKRQREAEEARRAQARRDQALLSSYNSIKDIDNALQRNEEEAQRIIHVSENEIAQLAAQKQMLLDDAEQRYPEKIPPGIEMRASNFDRQILEQKAVIEQQRKNIAVLRERFAEDKRRYLELKAAQQ